MRCPHHPGDVLDDEQLLRDDVPVPDVAVVDVHQVRLVHGDPAPGEDVVLDRHVVPVMLLHGGGALHFVQVPIAAIPDDDVRLHENVVVGKGRLVDGLRPAVDLLAGLGELLVLGQPVEGYDDSPGEQHVGVHADLVPACPERLELRRRLGAKLRPMPVEIEGFVALKATHVERLAQVVGLVRRGHLHSWFGSKK
jgi:hypothetical protein